MFSELSSFSSHLIRIHDGPKRLSRTAFLLSHEQVYRPADPGRKAPGVPGPSLFHAPHVRGNPVSYNDPTGHRTCGDGEAVDCDGFLQPRIAPVLMANPFVFTSEDIDELPKDFQKYAFQGVAFAQQLYEHEGWWSSYLNQGQEKALMFLLRLAFILEGYSGYDTEMWQELGFKEHFIDAHINKPGAFYKEMGPVGLMVYIGSREAVYIRIYEDDAPQWNIGSIEYSSAWDAGPKMRGMWQESGIHIEKIWSLVTNYTGVDIYGTGAYDFGQIPPMPNPITDVIIWKYGDQVFTKPIPLGE